MQLFISLSYPVVFSFLPEGLLFFIVGLVKAVGSLKFYLGMSQCLLHHQETSLLDTEVLVDSFCLLVLFGSSHYLLESHF